MESKGPRFFFVIKLPRSSKGDGVHSAPLGRSIQHPLENTDIKKVNKFTIPYAPIPFASGFGGGFGCLNTFSQGIWSTIEYMFLLERFECRKLLFMVKDRRP